jgi:hypothetical protein
VFSKGRNHRPPSFDDAIRPNATRTVERGRETFRFETWPSPLPPGDALHLRLPGLWGASGESAPNDLEVTLFDVTGRKIASLGSGIETGGAGGEMTWGGRDAAGKQPPPGVYFLRVRAPSARIAFDRTVVLH